VSASWMGREVTLVLRIWRRIETVREFRMLFYDAARYKLPEETIYLLLFSVSPSGLYYKYQ
jgi:hypothetical protein